MSGLRAKSSAAPKARLRASLAAAATLCIAITSCSSANPQTTTSAAAARAAKHVLGLVSIAATDVANARFITGATAVAKKHGWQVTVVDANGSTNQANSAMENMAQRHVSAILTLEFAVGEIGSGLQAARNAHIPVGTWGGGLAPGVVATVGSQGAIAKPITERMIATMHGKGSVLAYTLTPDVVCRARELEFDRIMANEPNIKVQKEEVSIPGYVQDGQRYATAWLASHPKGSGPLAIWGCWEDPVLGGIAALKTEGRTDVTTYGMNGSAAALTALQQGSLTATMWENASGEGATLATAVINAVSTISAHRHWTSETLNVPGVLVDKNSLGTFLQSHPGAMTASSGSSG